MSPTDAMLDSVNEVPRLTSEATSKPQSFKYAVILALRSGGYGSTTANFVAERSRKASIAATMLVVHGTPMISRSWAKSLVSTPLPWLKNQRRAAVNDEVARAAGKFPSTRFDLRQSSFIGVLLPSFDHAGHSDKADSVGDDTVKIIGVELHHGR